MTNEIRSFLSPHFSHFCRPRVAPTARADRARAWCARDSASLWRTKMAGAAVWVRGGAGAVVAQRA